MSVLIGTSGWQYADWKGRFYPQKMPQKAWLEHYADAFLTVEVNATFYRLPKPPAVDGWRDRTPDDFVVTLKVSRYLTHVKRLNEPEDSVRMFLDLARLLGPKLGPLLVQLPPNLQADIEKLDRTLRVFPSDLRVAVEFRHDSWFNEDTYAVLREHGAAFCLADRFRPITPLERTADWGYVRFHAGRGFPPSNYGRLALSGWARRIAELFPTEDVYAYFNNDHRACAVRNAKTFADACLREGLRPTRAESRTRAA